MNPVSGSDKGFEEISVDDINTHFGPDNGKEYKEEFFDMLEMDPSETIPYQNIRPIDPEHVDLLARSILKNGQLQECIGLYDDEGGVIVIGGRHRRLAVEKLNRVLVEAERPPMNLRIRVFKGHLSKAEIFQIQVDENLQNAMKPTERADALYLIWELYRQAFEEDKISFADLARKVGCSAAIIRDAVAFAEISPQVARLAREGLITYTLAVKLSSIQENESGFAHERQFRMANQIILAKLSYKVASKRILDVIARDNGELVSLFALEQEAALEEENIRLGIHGTVGKAASEASAYFKRILHLLDVYRHPSREMTFTPAVLTLLSELIFSASYFYAIIDEEHPEIAKLLMARLDKMHAEFGDDLPRVELKL